MSTPLATAHGTWDFVVIGAGAAGMVAALTAARRGVATLLLETREQPGAKIRVSGGGRCNVLPSVATLDDFHTEGSRNSLKNLLASWPLAEVRAFFERDLGIALKVEPNGKVFPAGDDAREVVDALLAEVERSGAVLGAGQRVAQLRRIEGSTDGARFEIVLEGGASLRAQHVAIATGGLSLPKSGSDGWGYAAAELLGHHVLPRYPALVPLIAADKRWNELAGIALVARLSALRGDKLLGARAGDFLFTHKGFSGPVVLDQSRFLSGPNAAGTTLVAAWLDRDAEAWERLLIAGGTRTVQLVMREHLPKRLVAVLLDRARVAPERKLSELSRDERKRVVRELGACPLEATGDEGYRTAEVTGGGVALDEVSTKTLESRFAPGLYFAGEVLDVTGRIGGFNFLWAWVSGRKVGLAVGALNNA